MKVYKCDACGRIIVRDEMNTALVRQTAYSHAWGRYMRRKTKIHLCGACFEGLHLIAERAKAENINNKGE